MLLILSVPMHALVQYVRICLSQWSHRNYVRLQDMYSYIKYISKCLALIARSAGVSSIYFKYLFSLLESHPTLGNLIFNNDMIGKFNFFVEKMRNPFRFQKRSYLIFQKKIHRLAFSSHFSLNSNYFPGINAIISLSKLRRIKVSPSGRWKRPSTI